MSFGDIVTCVKAELVDEQPKIIDSKFGGLGYVPRDGKIPVSNKGEQLRLLCQYRLEEIAEQVDKIDNNDSLKKLPRVGLLQFWILNDDLSGLNDESERAVIYYPEIDETVTDGEVQAKKILTQWDAKGTDDPDDFDMHPVIGEYKAKFVVDESFDSNWETSNYSEEEEDRLMEENSGKDSGHVIGGFPCFVQYDPREEGDTHTFCIQIDSDFKDKNDRICWGDAGSAQFLFTEDTIEKAEFSDYIYDWACG